MSCPECAELRRQRDEAREKAKAAYLFGGRGECDWGDCNEPAIALRNDKEGHGWLPVCDAHSTESIFRTQLALADALAEKLENDGLHKAPGDANCPICIALTDYRQAQHGDE